MPKLQKELIEGGYTAATPAAICYKATWTGGKKYFLYGGDAGGDGRAENITSTALIVVGNIIGEQYDRSLLYDPSFTTAFREATETTNGSDTDKAGMDQ